MKNRLKQLLNKKKFRRTVSLLTAFAVFLGTIHISEFIEDVTEVEIFSHTVMAVDHAFPWTLDTATNQHNITIFPSQLVAYSADCAADPEYHQEDHILITVSGNEGQQAFNSGFMGLGSEDYPFAGAIEIGSSHEAITLNLDAPLFNYVYDSVTLTNNGQALNIARAFDVEKTNIKEANSKLPLIAKNVQHDSSGTPATWDIAVVSPTAGTDRNLGNFGGFIGKMETDSELTLNLSMSTTDSDTVSISVNGAAASSGDDTFNSVGLICGAMESDSTLTVSLTGNRTVSSITTAFGHAGGLVGSLGENAVLDYTGTNIQTSGTDIKTTAAESYAGGLAGYNEGGTIKITLPSGGTAYPVGQYIEGTAGAGGLYGYLKPGATDTEDSDVNSINAETDVTDYAVNCQVNGTGYVGGLFGVLESEHDYSITGAGTVTSSHASGLANGYGGLIGRYNDNNLSDSLTISSVTSSPAKPGSATYYGGMIAAVAETIDAGETSGGSAYVKFDGTTSSVVGGDVMTFGGLVSKADNAFIDANGVTVSIDGEHKFKGGAVVGSLESGVLRMSGTTDLTNTAANLMSYDGGQIVGYRNNALIFGTDDWELKRGASVSVDDIGAWGEVVRFSAKDTDTEGETSYGFGTDKTVITVYEDDHYVQVNGPSYDENDSSVISIGSVSDFARTALNIQINDSGSTDGVLQFEETSNTSSSLSDMNILLGGDIDLSGTGISSLTRDNARTDSLEANKCVYSGTFDGDGHSITLAIGEPYGYRVDTELSSHSVEGNGKIYNHKYNGLFGITNTASESTTAQNVTFKGTIDVYSAKVDNTDRIAYVGAVAGRAKGDFSVENIAMTDQVTNDVHETVFSAYGSGLTYVGGLLGQASGEIEGISITDCNVKCNIQTSNTNENSCLGGVIGWIAYTGNDSRSWSFEKITVSGEINNTHARATNKVAGLVAAIAETTGQSNRILDLISVKADGLTVKSVGSGDSTMGGILGYTWLNVNTTFHNVEIANSNVNMMTGNGALGGLVYQGTGYWKVEPCSVTVTDENTGSSTTEYYDGIKIDGLTVSNLNAKSFGIILHSTKTDKTALYLEILADDAANSVKSYNVTSADFSNLKNGCVFDEIAAYTASKDTGANGQAVISIHSDDFSTEGGSTASGTYHAQTSRGAVPNPNTRYYYNLDTVRTATGDSDLLMRWALHIYAHSSIQGYFTNESGFSDNTIPNGTYDMKNYSWYPVDISSAITVNGTFTFYNKEFEESEQVKANSETNSYKRTSLYDNTNDQSTQHNLMHCGLFRNVTGGITIGTSGVSLKGNVGRYGKNNSKVSGALVCGTIKGSSTSSIATFTTNGNINLSGIYVHDHESNTYAPLLINKIGEFTTIVLKNVKAEGGKYSDNFKAASSLIGDVGFSGATNISLTFTDIQIDGRKTGGAYSLDNVYKTKSSLFYRATLLNTLRYSSGSATYDFNIGDDWLTNNNTYTRTGANGVTYGSEIDDADSQHLGKEYWYKDTNGGIYTNYNTPGASGSTAPSPVISFADFLPYVYDKCTAATINTADDKKYQIRVNWNETQMTGCGTYNDPYILTSAGDFNRIAELLSGSTGYSVTLPNADNPTALKQIKWDSTGHSDFTWDGGKFSNGSKSYDKVVVQNYLAGAYYIIEENKNITLNSDFKGFGNTTEEQAIFRGVIVGNGEIITLTGVNPLIFASNGSVVKNINISVNVSQISINQTNSQKISSSHKSNTNAKTYGAVIGRILGGDNIIDGVTVNYGSSKIKFTSSNEWNQTVPVGGYVGTVEKGTLIFKGMENGTVGSNSYLRGTNAIIGLKDDTVVDSTNNPCLYTTNSNGKKTENMKWLYVNPIVGRVINAAVFTEGTAYRPFEDGTREGVYIKNSSTDQDPQNIEDYRSVAVETTYEKYSEHVTMQNGTKNYSIADITPNLPMFTTGVPERTSSFEGSEDFRRYLVVDIGLPNAQSLYVMSLVTQTGLGAKNYLQRSKRGTTSADNRFYPDSYNLPVGGFYNTGKWGIAPYYKFRATHVAEYTYVGKCGGGNIPEPTSDMAWYEDYNNAKTDNAQYNRTGAANSEDNYARQHAVDVLPYLIKYYTPKIPVVTESVTPNQFDTNYFNNIKNKELGYIAFNITHQYTYLNLEFTGSEITYYMPDGFRGLGTFGYYNYTNNSTGEFSEVYQDLIVHLFGIEGNNNTIDLNMNYYCYYSYDPYAIDNVSPGFGFINAMMQNKTVADDSIDPDNENYQIRNFTLTGSVNSEVIDISTGLKYNYNNSINSGRYWAVGGLAGNVVYSRKVGDATSGGDIYKIAISSISLSNLKVNGVNSAGGVLGYNKSANHADSKTTIRNISTSDLEVSSGLYTGGLIGYSTDTALDISNVTIAEPNIKSYLSFTSATKINANATGGIVGYVATGTNNGPVYLHEITIGAESPTTGYSANIGYNEPTTYPTSVDYESVRVGGLIGQTASNSSTMISNGDIVYNTKIEKCNIYNVDVKGHYTGGVIGVADATTITIGVSDTIVKSTSNNSILGHRVDNASRGTGGIAGYINAGNFVIMNCLIEGYTIKSTQRTGGVVGYTKATKTEIDNTEVKDVKFVSNASVGGLVGYLDNPLNGYNIRTDGISFVPFSGSGSYSTGNNPTLNTRGHIVGYNNSKVIKLAGFSRNTLNPNVDCGSERMVGNYADTYTPYRSGGYVVFADYYNTYSGNLKMSTVASTVNNAENVTEAAYKIDTHTTATNSFPYVNVSPKLVIENGESGRFLTGDAVASSSYSASVYKKILSDKSSNKIGCYTNYKTTNKTNPSNAITVTDTLTGAINASNFSTSSDQMSGTGAPIIPVLVIEDTDYQVVTQMLNTYINVLANTGGYNYAADDTIHRISLNKCTYSNGTYTIGENGSACLKQQQIGDKWYFRMTSSNVDNAVNGVFQFSLLDVQFLNPSDTSEVAYHLYIPVYVKKLLQYKFRAAMISNTDYYANAYGTLNGNSLFENLGNPVTLKFEYNYTRNAGEWKDAINGGENVLTNIYKTIEVTEGAWPAGTRMVLVDANNNDKAYYLDTPASGSISLYDFTDESGNHFKPAPLNNLMSVTVGQPTTVTERVLTPVAIDSSLSASEKLEAAIDAGATVYSNGTYYRPVTDADTELTADDKWAVTAVSGLKSERYYLSIFTPKSSDTTIYYYQFSGPESLTQRSSNDKFDGYRPNHMANTGIEDNAYVHFYIGDIFDNQFSMAVSSKIADRREMSKSNNYLKVTMSSTVQLKSVATEIDDEDPASAAYDKTRKGIAQNMRANIGKSEVYQAFLSTYDKVDTTGGSSNVSINMQTPPLVIVKEYHCYAGTDNTGTVQTISYTSPTVENGGINENYIRLLNNKDIIPIIGYAANDYAVTYELEYELHYDENDLPAQFSLNAEGVDGVGTKVIGYSNISSSQNNIAYTTSSKKDDTTSLRYYVSDSSQATLNYVVKKTSGEMLGPYSDLGINALDNDEATEHIIHTYAQYDTNNLKNSGDYIEFSIKLSNKSDYSAYLPISTYVKQIKITGAYGTIFDSTSMDNGATLSDPSGTYLKVTKLDNEYKIRVHKSYVQTQGASDSGRYNFPIELTVYTGDEKFNNTGLMYSNYKISVHAEMWTALMGGTESDPSNADSELIYTNAKVYPEVID